MANSKRDWTRLVTWAALLLAVGAVVAALIAAIGSATELWGFRAGLGSLRYFFSAAAGAVLGLIGLVMARRRAKHMLANLVALVVALGFVLYLGNLVANREERSGDPRRRHRSRRSAAIHAGSRSAPTISRISPTRTGPSSRRCRRRKGGRRCTAPLRRSSDRPTGDPAAETVRRAAALARERGWDVALVDEAAGTVEATETSRFFRFKDDVVIRVRPAPGGGSLVDMRSISRVGGSDVGMNAKRVRAFLTDLQPAAAG